MNQSFSPWAYGVMSLVKTLHYWQMQEIRKTTNESPFLHQSIISHQVIDCDRQMATWIVFRHASVERHASDGVWEEGTFEYHVWRLDSPELMPVLMRIESVTKQHPDGLASTPALADDVMSLQLDGAVVFSWEQPVQISPALSPTPCESELLASCA